MSTIDTSTWSPDSSLNTDIGGIPLNADASIQQTWQAIQMLMAALKGDTSEIELTINQPDGTTIVATNQTLTVVDNGHAHVIANVTGLQAALDGKQAAGSYAEASHTHGSITNDGKLGTASMAVQTDASGSIAASGVTATELACLSGVTSAVQTQLDAKAADSGVVHLAETETVPGAKTFSSTIKSSALDVLAKTADNSVAFYCGGSSSSYSKGAKLALYGSGYSTNTGGFALSAGGSALVTLLGLPNGTLTWNGQPIQTSSDERLKTPLASVPDEVLDAWEDVQWGQFRYLRDARIKGDAARLHLGLIAQRAKCVFEARGLDACAYGILCHEEREASGDEPAVDLWTVRYAEALAMEAACQRRRADRLEARIKMLEEKLQ